MKSSLMRMSLARHIRQVISSGEDLVVEHDGKEVAVLSLTPPKSGTAPLRMKLASAQAGWADLLNIVSLRGARYYFKLKPLKDEDDTPTVYLYRYKQCNRFVEDWNRHLEQQKLSKVKANDELEGCLDKMKKNIDVVAKQLEDMRQVMRCTFTAGNRDGHFPNTPDMSEAPFSSTKDSSDDDEF